MDDDTATVQFREQLRRTSSQQKRKPGARQPDETTALLPNGNGNGTGDGDAPAGDPEPDSQPSRSATWDFFLNREDTPGRNSDNLATRTSAHVWHVTKVTLLSNYVNVLLFMVPVAIIAGAQGWNPTVVFVLNFFAIIPLAAVLSFATEEISIKLGETLGGLLNATFGNAVELIVSVIALKEGQIQVVQSSMLGSILSNLLLVMGMCFVFGGIANMRDQNGVGTEQSFASATAQTTCSLMALSSASMIIPATLYTVLDEADLEKKQRTILILSRGTAIILLFLYVLYLFFQLRTHKNLFDAEAQHIHGEHGHAHLHGHGHGHGRVDGAEDGPDDEEGEEPMISPLSAGLVLVFTTALVAVCADYLVASIDDTVRAADISKNFVGLILIPIVGNAAEHVTAVVVAVRNKMDLAMGVAIGSSIQIALLVTPFLVILGWLVLDQPMTLQFETFETVAFAMSVLLVTYCVQDGKSNYLEGAMLMGLYVIIALAFYASPSEALDKVLGALSFGH